MSPEQRASKLLDIADMIGSVRPLVLGADLIAVQIDGREADAVHEILKEVEHRLTCIACELDEARTAA